MVEISVLKTKLKELLGKNEVKKGTKTALKYEFFYIHGAYAAHEQEMPPAVVLYLMSGRSILDMPETNGEVSNRD